MPRDLDLARRSHALLVRAMELEAGARRAWVRDQCGDDDALLQRMNELLDASDRAEAFLSRPALDALTTRMGLGGAPAGGGTSRGSPTDATPPDEIAQIPDAVGEYVVVGVLGSGGMATVYEAIQEHPRRRVALKVLHRSMNRADVYQRFKFETEALARLRHPGIAQIYEAGAAHLGPGSPSPFFAMELVPGATPITAYAARRRLPLEERLRMIAGVCDAVHHGHQQGIIHRDLKPANVLVDDKGQAKVIDFGVARRVAPATGAEGEAITREGDASQIVGTLNYMSPEQCGSGVDVDIRTDVYALGVLLYEMVCGRLPHDLSGLPLGAALHRVVHEPPRSVTAPGVPRRRDLEAIVMRAIAPHPVDRYDSASSLAGDLRRYLDDRPVVARPGGAMEQARRLVRRHKALAAMGATIGVAILVVASVSTAFAVRLGREATRRRLAEQTALAERDQARWRAYTADIAGALSALQADEFLQMRARLSDVSYEPRGWEWGFLSRMAERSTRVIPAHDDLIFDMAASADATRVYTGAGDGSVRAWDPATGRRLAAFQSATGGRVTGLALMEDRGVLAVGDAEGGLYLLDALTLEPRRTFGPIPGGVEGLAALDDGRLLIAGSRLPGVWSPGSETIDPLPGEQAGGVLVAATSPDGVWAATANNAGVVCVRRARDLAIVATLAFPGAVSQVRFSRDGSMLSAVGSSSRLLVWSVPDGRVLHSIEATGGINTVRSVAFSWDGSLVAAGLVHRGIVVYRTSDATLVGRLGGHAEAVSALTFAPDDTSLISASWDGTIRTWDPAEIESPGGMVTLRGHQDHVFAAAFSPDGAVLASAAADGTLRLWNPVLGEQLAAWRPTGNALAALAFSPDASMIAVGGSTESAMVLDARTGAVIHEIPGNIRGVGSLAFDPTGQYLARGGGDGVLRVFNLRTGADATPIQAHTGRINSVAFSPDGRLIATASRDRTVRLWRADTGDSVACMDEHRLDVFAVLFSSDGARLYSGSRDQTIKIWDVATATRVGQLAGHGQYVTSLALSPDGSRLAAGSWFGEIVLFDLASSDLIASLRAHDAAIRAVAFSPDGRFLASASYDATVRLFDSATREQADAARRAQIQPPAARASHGPP